jgi:hypothetical protein
MDLEMEAPHRGNDGALRKDSQMTSAIEYDNRRPPRKSIPKKLRHQAGNPHFIGLPDGGYINLATIGQIYRYARDEVHFYNADGALVHRERAEPPRLDVWMQQIVGAAA